MRGCLQRRGSIRYCESKKAMGVVRALVKKRNKKDRTQGTAVAIFEHPEIRGKPDVVHEFIGPQCRLQCHLDFGFSGSSNLSPSSSSFCSSHHTTSNLFLILPIFTVQFLY